MCQAQPYHDTVESCKNLVILSFYVIDSLFLTIFVLAVFSPLNHILLYLPYCTILCYSNSSTSVLPLEHSINIHFFVDLSYSYLFSYCQFPWDSALQVFRATVRSQYIVRTLEELNITVLNYSDWPHLTFMDLTFMDQTFMDQTFLDQTVMNLTFINLTFMNLTSLNLTFLDPTFMDLTFLDQTFMDLTFMSLTFMNLNFLNLSFFDLSFMNQTFLDLPVPFLDLTFLNLIFLDLDLLHLNFF